MVKESFESFVFLRGANCQHRYCVLEVSLGPASMRPELSAALANPLAKPPRFGEPGFDESPAAAWCWRYYTEFRRNKHLDISSVSLWLLTTLQPGRSHLCLDCLDWYCIAFYIEHLGTITLTMLNYLDSSWSNLHHFDKVVWLASDLPQGLAATAFQRKVDGDRVWKCTGGISPWPATMTRMYQEPARTAMNDISDGHDIEIPRVFGPTHLG